MNINQVINRFPLDKVDTVLEIFIGKNLNRQMFNINNKIFFDIVYSYLIKNGWNIQNQYIMKSIQSKNIILENVLQNELSNLFNFEIPFTSNSTLYRKNNVSIKKYKGTYYDILCNYYEKQNLDTQEFQKNIDSIYNETIEEITIFHKKSTPFSIQLNLEKISESMNTYSVKVIFTDSISNEESILELFEIIDLAMSKYKKTDKTITSIFEPLN